MRVETEGLDFLAVVGCLPLKTLNDLLKIKNGYVGAEQTSFKICDVLHKIGLCLLVLRNLLLERTDQLGRGQVRFIVLFKLLFEIPNIGLKSEKDVVRGDKWDNIRRLTFVKGSLSIDLAVRVLSSSTYIPVARCLSWGVENSSSFSSYISLVQ